MTELNIKGIIINGKAEEIMQQLNKQRWCSDCPRHLSPGIHSTVPECRNCDYIHNINNGGNMSTSGDETESQKVWDAAIKQEPIAVVVNNNQPGWRNIVETSPHVTLPIGMKLYREGGFILPQPTEDGLVIVNKQDAEAYCKILSLLGMEEEGDPVAAVAVLVDRMAMLERY